MKQEFRIGDKYFHFIVNNISTQPAQHANGRWVNIIYCKCVCGRDMVLREYQLRRRKSCGCRRGNKKYPDLDVKSYSSWRNIKNRCTLTTMTGYEKYGAVGIKICKGLTDYNFFKKILGEPPSIIHSVDRYPNNDKNYSCGECEECKSNKWELNVRWATPKEQSENRKMCYAIDIDGKVVTLKEACRIKGLPYKQVHEKIKRYKWNIYLALNTPINKLHPLKHKKLINDKTE